MTLNHDRPCNDDEYDHDYRPASACQPKTECNPYNSLQPGFAEWASSDGGPTDDRECDAVTFCKDGTKHYPTGILANSLSLSLSLSPRPPLSRSLSFEDLDNGVPFECPSVTEDVSTASVFSRGLSASWQRATSFMLTFMRCNTSMAYHIILYHTIHYTICTT